MKRAFIALIMSILTLALFAQQTITIGTGSQESTAPVYTGYDYTVSQMIYTSTELQQAGLTTGRITSLRFQAGAATMNLLRTRTWNIRMMETPATDMDSWLDPASTTEVYNADHGIDTLPAGQWLDITLSTPFLYSGNQNLLVQVMDLTPNYASSNKFRGHITGETNLTRYAYRDTTPYDPINNSNWLGIPITSESLASTTIRPNIQIVYTAPTAGIDLTITTFTGPAQIPGTTTPFSITVMNSGTTAASSYAVEIYEVGGSPSALYTVPAGSITPLPTTFATTDYTIAPAVYNEWSFVNAGNITLQAKVSIDSDQNPQNDTATIVTYVLPQNDIRVIGFTGPAMLPTAHPINITIHNNGSQALSATDYSITLYETGSPDVEITTIPSVALAPDATATLNVDSETINTHNYTNITANTTTFKVVATLIVGDQFPADNMQTYQARWFNGDTNAVVEVGLGGTNTNINIPFNLWYEDSYAQSIYRPADFGGIEAGYITDIMYLLRRANLVAAPDPYPVTIWMANYDGRPNGFANIADWVPHSEFTQVVTNYNLSLSALPIGDHEIWIPLSTPFLYTGGDLIVMTYKDHDNIINNSLNVFLQTNNVADSNVSLAKYRDEGQGGEQFDPTDVTIGTGDYIDDALFNFKPQMRLAFNTSGTTASADLAVINFTAPTLIPANTTENMLIHITNFSSAVDVAPTDYTIEIAEVIAGTPITLATLSSTSTPPTVALASGNTESATLIIPSSIFNLWAFQGATGATTLKAEIIYQADTNASNNETTAETALRPPYQIQLTTFTAPMFIPSADPIVITVANNGRAVIAEAAYSVEIFQVYHPATEHLLYSIGTQVTAEAIGLADVATYTIAPEVYNAWPYNPNAPASFSLKAVLTYNHSGQDFTTNISLDDRQLGSQFDLEVLQFTGPAIMPSFTPISIALHNNGRASVAATDYTLKLYTLILPAPNPTPTLIYTFGVGGNAETVAIDITDTVTYAVPAAAIRAAIAALPAGHFDFMAEVELLSDANPANNTMWLGCIKSDMLTDGIAEVGIANNTPTIFGNNGVLPFDGYNYDSISQSIYTNADLAGLESGIITHINYRYFRGDSNLSPGIVDIYMANASRPSGFTSTTDWVPYSAFTLVKANYSVNNTALPAGANDIWIQLDNTFTYTGQDLVIMTHKESNNTYCNGDGYYQTEPVPASNISLYRSHENGNYNPQDPAAGANGTPTRLHYKPQMRFAIVIPSTGADLAITDFSGTEIIPGTEPLLVTVQNTGIQPILASEYYIVFYQGDETTPLYTHTGTAGLPALGDAHDYEIPASVYNTWAYQGAEGATTLKAVIDFIADSNETNNTITYQTNLRPAYDIAMLSAVGPAMFPAINPMQITLQNNGRAVVAPQSYSIAVNIGANTIYTIPLSATREIGLGATETYTIPASTINPLLTNITGDFTFTVAVVSNETEAYTNNNSTTLDASIFNEFTTDGIVEVGIEGFVTSYWVPLSLHYPTSISQSIYHASFFQGVEAGLITHINYTLRVEDDIQQYPISIYMANYDKTSFTSDYNWVPGSAFTLVADQIQLPVQEQGLISMWLELDTPYFYTGGDLIVMPYSEQMDWFFWSEFLISPNIAPDITIFQRDDYVTYNPLNLTGLEGERRAYLPQTRFAFSIGEYGVLSGNTTLAGVVVSQGERSVTSNADGEYAIIVDTQATTPITFEKEGYAPQTLAISSIQWNPQPDGLPTATHNVVMTTVPSVVVCGTITSADTGTLIFGSVTVQIGSHSQTTSNGTYGFSGLYPYTTYPVTVTLPDNANYQNFTSQLRFTLEETIALEYIYNITLAEAVKAPPYAYTTFTPTSAREVSWFNPLAEEEAIGLYVPSGGNYSYSEMTDAIFAHKYSSERLNALGLPGAYLTAVSFLPRYSDQEVSIVIWVGDDLSEADIDHPTLEQPITETVYLSNWNTVALKRPILVPENSELLVGIRSIETVLWVYDGGDDSFVGEGNIIYIDGFWTDLINLTEGADGGPFYDDWAIRSSFVMPFPTVTTGSFSYSVPAKTFSIAHNITNNAYSREFYTGSLPQPPNPPSHRLPDTRFFNSKYGIYRLPEGATFNPNDTPLDTVQASGFMPTFTDNSELIGRYRYVITSVYEGDAYPVGGMQSAPTYTNYVNISPWFVVNGSITRTNGTLAGFDIGLRNVELDEYSPQPVTTGEAGTFSFLVPAGEYIITAHLEGVNADGIPYGTYTNTVIVTEATTIPPINMTSLSDADEVTVPMTTALKGNYPNPFNPSTTIAFDLAREGQVTIEVFNIKGQRVSTIAHDVYQAGRHNVVWNGNDANGRTVGSGVYFYRMTTDGYVKTQKMLLMK